MSDSFKTCPKCGKTKGNTFENFYRDASKSDGLTTICKPCKNIGSAKWNKSPAGKKFAKQYRESHREQNISYLKQWRLQHPEYATNHGRKFKLAHPGLQPNQKAWRAKNRSKWRLSMLRAKHRRRVKMLGNDVRAVDYRLVYEDNLGFCGICFKPVAFEDASWDHIIAVSKGGAHTEENIQPVHRICNSIKGDRTLEWARIRVATVNYNQERIKINEPPSRDNSQDHRP